MAAQTGPAPERWDVVDQATSRTGGHVVVRNADSRVVVTLERCARGRLREAYPVNEHDLEARLEGVAPLHLEGVLSAVVPAVFEAEPACRWVVFAVPESDLRVLSAAEEAGFRYVVTVDLPDGSVSLAVAEPAWVTAVDMDLDHVPQT